VRVAVTGASGYIGGWLTAELRERGHDVYAQDATAPGLGSAAWAEFHVFDLASHADRAGWLHTTEPDVVVHLAALYGRVWGEVDVIKTAADNAGLTAALACDTASVGARLMLVSSSEVYGESANEGTVYPASSPTLPMNMYGLTKKWSEEAAAVYAPYGLMIARLNMPYGPSQLLPATGTVPATSGRAGPVGYHALHTMLWQASHDMDITVHKGTSRCFTWAGDTIRGMAVILESGEAGIWNVSRNDDHQPMTAVARRVVEMAGSHSRVREEEPPPRVTLRKSLDNTSLLNLGWRPTVALDDGMKRTWEHFRCFDENGVWRG
jgi:nucleoside-diphosphate-sugar epimerase